MSILEDVFSLDGAIFELDEGFKYIANCIKNIKAKGKECFLPQFFKGRIETLKSTWINMKRIHNRICVELEPEQQAKLPYITEGRMSQAAKTYEDTLDFCYIELGKVQQMEPSSPGMSSTRIEERPIVSNQSACKLQPLQLPKFTGDIRAWMSFADMFKSAVTRSAKYSGAEKLAYLKFYTEGEPNVLIVNLESTNENFELAWQTLEQRYENKRIIITQHMYALFDLPILSLNNYKELRKTVILIHQSIASLKLLDCPINHWDMPITFNVIRKFDEKLRKDWEDHLENSADFPTFEVLKSFLNRKLNALEALQQNYKFQPSSTIKSHNSVQSEKKVCKFCKENHLIYFCQKFKNLNEEEKYNFVRQKKLCMNCLNEGHMRDQCQSKFRCLKCERKHNVLLHREAFNSNQNKYDSKKFDGKTAAPTQVRPSVSVEVNKDVKSEKKEKDKIKKDDKVTLSSTLNVSNDSSVLLATAIINVADQFGNQIKARALIDSASESSFITEKLAQILRIKKWKKEVTISGINGENQGKVKFITKVTLTSRFNQKIKVNASPLIIRKITSYLPPKVLLPNLSFLQDLKLADPEPMSQQPIDILLGADVYATIIKNGLKKGKVNEPVAHNTIFGWILLGPIGQGPIASHCISVNHGNLLEDINNNLKAFWESEEISVTDSLSPEEKDCEEQFVNSVKLLKDGHYSVALPFKEREPQRVLGNSLNIAKNSLFRLEKVLIKNEKVYEQYREFIKEYVSLGHMTKLDIPLDQIEEFKVFIPHRAVIREDSQTTKLRVVFNASSVTSSGVSLNDTLHIGPKLQKDITSILMQWRLHKYVLISDVEKMFRQIWIEEKDRKFQNILWRDFVDDKINAYQLNTVTYGTKPAPYIAMRVIKQAIKDFGDEFPLAKVILSENIYVDDVIFGASDPKLLMEMKNQVCSLVGKVGMNLRKWGGNSSAILETIPQEEYSHAIELNSFDSSTLKILGIRWIPSEDEFNFSVTPITISSDKLTKRIILSEVAKIFDPNGWLSPVIIKAKILLQSLWLEKLDWDDQVSSSVVDRWTFFCNDWMKLNKFKLPRWVGLESPDSKIELHGFSDASLQAFSAVVYIKVIENEESHISLLMAKSKVAPIKSPSLPKLELNGCKLLSKLLVHVRESLKIPIDKIYCWTDSKICLDWIRKQPSNWEVFVSNRVAEIQTLLPEASWNYVNTKENPADLNSRGLAVDDLLNNNLWFQGPSWLAESQECWGEKVVIEDTDLNKRKMKFVFNTNTEQNYELFEKYSSWSKLLRVVALVLKFVNILRKRNERSNEFLKVEDIQLAKEFIVKSVQKSSFAKELLALKNKKLVNSNSSLFKLNPMLDEKGIIRVGGRLSNSIKLNDFKYPIVLPRHFISTLIVRQCHANTLHGGVQLTLRMVRESFWIIGARSLVKQIIYQCITCTRQKAKLSDQYMSDLTADRVKINRPFTVTGVDYAGPFLVRNNSGRGYKTHKTWVAVFVCFTTRAIHLELVNDYSSNAFLAAFDRFVSRRGLPSKMLSDNGCNFVGADKELRRQFIKVCTDKEVKEKMLDLQIRWSFNPPAAPHFGGLQEAGVKAFKFHLKRIMGKFFPTVEEFTTILCKIESCLNSRPLAALKDDVESFDALTPGHFLIGNALNSVPHESIENTHENLLNRWLKVRVITQAFWRRWYNEYLCYLQNRTKWNIKKQDLKVGDLVLIKNPIYPPSRWDMGRIKEIFFGQDNLVRVVLVKTKNSELKRPIHQLCKLPDNLD